jgi:hypothetical protein
MSIAIAWYQQQQYALEEEYSALAPVTVQAGIERARGGE